MQVDLLITNGYVVTMDAERRILESGAVAIKGNEIVEVGPSDELAGKYTAARTIDGTNTMIVPGLINCHSHTTLSVLRGVSEEEGPGSLYNLLFPLKRLWNDERLYNMAMVGMLENLRLGATTVVENYDHMLALAPAAEKVGLRCVMSENVLDADTQGMRRGEWRFDPAIGEKTLQDAVDLVEQWHGKADGRITCMMAAHAADLCSPELLQRIRKTADEYKLRVTFHCCQTLQELEQVKARTGLTPVEYMHEYGLIGEDVVAAHCVYVSESDIELLGRTGTHMSHNPAINAKRGKSAPLKALWEAGMNIGFGTDNMHGNMLEAMKIGIHIGRVREDDGTFMQAMEVLEMATLGGAKAIGMEEKLGSLEAGKLADLLVINMRQPYIYPLTKPVSNFIYNGMGTDIDKVIVDGRVLIDGGLPTHLDHDEVLDRAQATSDEIWGLLPHGA